MPWLSFPAPSHDLHGDIAKPGFALSVCLIPVGMLVCRLSKVK